MKEPVTHLDYCQYLLISQINYTLTNFAGHCEQFSHDARQYSGTAKAVIKGIGVVTCVYVNPSLDQF